MSSFYDKLKATKQRVEYLLMRHPHLRDNDNKLIANIWYKESKSMDSSNFLKDFSDGKYTNPESIRRCRQKLQEDHVYLRGKNYRSRKKESEEVKQKILDL